MEVQYILAGITAFGVIVGMQFKINRCLGRMEGEVSGLKTMLTAHLAVKK